MIERLLRALSQAARTFSESLGSDSSSRETPQPMSSATPDTLLQTMKQMLEVQEKTTRTFCETMVSMLQGRPTQATTPQSLSTETFSQQSSPDDMGPLTPGIEAIIAREEEEDGLRALMEERERLQRQLASQAAMLDRQGPASLN